MSPSSSGSEPQGRSHVYALADSSQVGEARRFAQGLCEGMGFAETRRGRVGIIVNELGNNLVRYATEGRLVFRKTSTESGPGLEILSVDKGPGLDDAVVMRDGFSTGSTPGTGLGAVKRLADEFDIHSVFGRGSVVLARVLAHEPTEARRSFDVGAINVPVSPEIVSGDGWAVRWRGEDFDLLVVDGLGHGEMANRAAAEAIAGFEQDALPPDRMLERLHGRLKATRGAAVFLLSSRQGMLDFAGVGNIRAVVSRNGAPLKTLISQNGTAGLQVRSPKMLSQAWEGDGYLILHSDGINGRWDLGTYPGLGGCHPAVVTATLFRDFCRGNDDATVVAMRRRP